MKIVHTTGPVNTQHLKAFLENNLNTRFKENRHMDMDLEYVDTENGLEIKLPELYDSFLFEIHLVNGNELHVAKSEHFVNDVNALTIEEILNSLLLDYSNKENNV
ncbi:hypothetical protein [Mucilaginibacter terrae]|uniref:DUF3630 family protein n=1 Tax=Mucilaginibacter terrae TaxID=1955052 RepID=A0ABU3GTU0_9SPHI|nr:hypothetical protein [Mucilaginibacter terrae]MDT3403179.1 hypothetical protein [Mucilaginibacter terrae]